MAEGYNDITSVLDQIKKAQQSKQQALELSLKATEEKYQQQKPEAENALIASNRDVERDIATRKKGMQDLITAQGLGGIQNKSPMSGYTESTIADIEGVRGRQLGANKATYDNAIRDINNAISNLRAQAQADRANLAGDFASQMANYNQWANETAYNRAQQAKQDAMNRWQLTGVASEADAKILGIAPGTMTASYASNLRSSGAGGGGSAGSNNNSTGGAVDNSTGQYDEAYKSNLSANGVDIYNNIRKNVENLQDYGTPQRARSISFVVQDSLDRGLISQDDAIIICQAFGVPVLG